MVGIANESKIILFNSLHIHKKKKANEEKQKTNEKKITQMWINWMNGGF